MKFEEVIVQIFMIVCIAKCIGIKKGKKEYNVENIRGNKPSISRHHAFRYEGTNEKS